MEQPSFVHLQVHSEFSLLDGAIRINELLSTCNERNATSIALTDKGNLFGAIDFYFGAKKMGINPIIGCEVHLCEDMSAKTKTMDRLILLCQNQTGYQHLCHILSEAHVNGFYYVPRIDMTTLKQHADGLICISPGYWGPVAQQLQSHFIDHAEDAAQALSACFPERFYLGIQRTGELGEDQLNTEIMSLSNRLNLPLVALNDVYFIDGADGWMQDMLHCIKTGREIDIDDQNNSKRSQHFLKPAVDMVALFADLPEAIENTVKIANQCQLELIADQVLLPRFECPDGLTPEAYLKQLVWKGIEQKYTSITDGIQQRVAFELEIINKMQYPIYFLIIHDFLDFCVQQNIPVGPGRGSAAGSIVAYALNITKIDPMAYNLLFERFLNPERVSMPDIDIDFCIKRRGEVIDYISKKYGNDHVAQIVTFGTMAARGVVRDVGRALGVPLASVDRIAKLIPSAPGQNISIQGAIDSVDELKNTYNGDPQAKQLLDYGMKLEGFARHSSTHAAGLVISRDPLASMVPLMNNDGQITTHFTMNNLEKLGLLKMDILGLRNLTVIRDACDIIQQHQPSFDIETIPFDDAATYDLLSSGESIGIFQCESPGMRRLIVDLKPKCFEDIIALLALYRPGPLGSGMVSDFISNKSGKTKVVYDLPQLEPILKDTYGMIVYQEQVMQIASEVGGFSLGQSDMLRRAMGKKKKDDMDKMKDEFLSGAKQKKISPTIAEKIFDLCYKFAEYGFNKSHSAAYAMISYQTAYLKAHFPNEYLLGLLASVLGNTDRTSVYVSEARRLGIALVPPSVNVSAYHHQLDGSSIIIGLGCIKGIGEAPAQAIVTERTKNGPFKTLLDFFERLKNKDVNKRVIEHLVKAGGLDCLDSNRSKILGCFEEILDKMHASSRHASAGQVGLFQSLDTDFYTDILNESVTHTYAPLELLRFERELTGEYLSAHPLDNFLNDWKTGVALSDIGEPMDKEVIKVVGVLSNVAHRTTKTNRPFSMGDIEDFGKKITILAFESPAYSGIAGQLKNDAIVALTGKVKVRQGEVSLMVESVEELSQQLSATICHVDLLVGHGADELNQIKQICLLHRGQIPLYFHVQTHVIQVNKKYWIKDSAIAAIKSIVGEQKVWLET
ncbi:MAG: DNA polymerase III subunit alpha [Candidatus Margulisbacteria bacterium]|nr:DNA polymerase III subunit alpha [Candidatus Margulisiibacteriota bacterium]